MPDEDWSENEPDLGALFARVFPRLAALEEPVLRGAGLSMWEYAIVSELATSEVVSQVELSRRTRRDPTRLGRHLDDLVDRGLVVRARSQDQRQHTARLSLSGYTLYKKVKRSIRTVEDELLHSTFSPGDAIRLRHLLARLASNSSAEAPD